MGTDQLETTESPPVDRLLRGVSTGHTKTVRDAWRDLLKQPEESVVAVRSKLARSAWAEPPRGPASGYLGALLAVLDELDSDAFASEVKRLYRSRLHPIHRRTIVFLAKRLKEEPLAFIEERIPVYVSTDIADRRRVLNNLLKWSKTPGLTLDGVTRISAVPRVDLDYLGLYWIHTSDITVTWPPGPVRGPRRWYQTLRAEFTFYHEAGHHALGHLEGGPVEEQEKEADRYAAAFMKQQHPVLTGLLSRIIRPVARRVLAAFVKNVT